MATLIHTLIFERSLTQPDSTAIVDLSLPLECQIFSYQHLLKQIDKTVQFFKGIGISKNVVVAIVIPNSIDFIISFLSVTFVGGIVAPINSAFTTSEFIFCLEDCKATHIISSSRFPKNSFAEAAVDKCKLVHIVLSIDCETSSVSFSSIATNTKVPGDPPNNVTEFDTCLVLHTSGSTSRPKLVGLSHLNVCSTITNIISTYKLSFQDATYLVMPLFHVHGLMCSCLSTLASGGKLVIPPEGKFSASRFWNDVKNNRVTWYSAVPTIHQVLLWRAVAKSEDFGSPTLRFIRSCSAPLAPSLLEKLEAIFNVPILEAYAMTEAAHQISSNPLPDVAIRKSGTVGIGQNVEVAILDEKGNLMHPESVGEVCICGSNVGKYINDEEANKAAFTGKWFRTGDLGKLDSDGYLTLVGRVKEIIIRGGEKISPVEVDSFLLSSRSDDNLYDFNHSKPHRKRISHIQADLYRDIIEIRKEMFENSHEGVAEAVTFGVRSEKYGEEVNAAVVLKSDNIDLVTEKDLKDYCKNALCELKIPSKIFITTSLPKTSTGKIQRRFVAEHFLRKP